MRTLAPHRLSWTCDDTRFERVFAKPEDVITAVVALVTTEGVTPEAAVPVEAHTVSFGYPDGTWETLTVFAADHADAAQRAAARVMPGWRDVETRTADGDRVLHLI